MCELFKYCNEDKQNVSKKMKTTPERCT